MTINFISSPKLEKRNVADILVLPFWKEKSAAAPAGNFKEYFSYYELPVKTKDFTGKEGEIVIVYAKAKQEKRILLLGLGPKDKVTIENLRRAYGQLTKACHTGKYKNV